MKIYAFDLLPWPYLEAPSYYPDPNALFDPARAQQVYAEHLEQMALYEEYGFDAICMNEHHSKPYGLMPSPNIVAAALIQRTRRISSLGPCSPSSGGADAARSLPLAVVTPAPVRHRSH
jgi:Luciferase-like monooxygenase